jgi:hypothetical protein
MQATEVKNDTVTQEVVSIQEIEGKVFTDKDISFQDLLKKTGSYECTVKQSVAGVTTEGKVYIKGENMHAQFSSKVQGQSFETSMITKDGFVYTWSSAAPASGIKTKVVTTATQGATTTNLSSSYAWDAKDIGSYSCVVANIPAEKFVVPATVVFTELNQ